MAPETDQVKPFKESQTASGLVVIEKDASPWYAPYASELDWFFPKADPQHVPLGNKIIVQLKRTRQKTDSGIHLVEETKSDEKWNTQIAKVISLGSIAYCNRSNGEPWPEGAWAQPGDFVRVPRWGGDRWNVKLKDETEEVVFCLFNDHEANARVTGDPLAVRIYIL